MRMMAILYTESIYCMFASEDETAIEILRKAQNPIFSLTSTINICMPKMFDSYLIVHWRWFYNSALSWSF